MNIFDSLIRSYEELTAEYNNSANAIKSAYAAEVATYDSAGEKERCWVRYIDILSSLAESYTAQSKQLFNSFNSNIEAAQKEALKNIKTLKQL